MAGVAQVVDARHVQEPCVLRTVRTVATHAAFCLYRGMLVDKWPTHLRVALGADQIRVISGAQVALLESAVHVMAICALDQAFIDLVVEWHIECRLGVGVALEAELGLFCLKQLLGRFRSVDAVAAQAADVRFGMRGAIEVGMGAGVAAEAGVIDLLRAEFFEALDLRDVATAIDVSLAGTVAALAGDAFALVLEGETGVGIRSEVLRDIRVTSGAGFLTDEVRRIHCRLWLGS